jgi:hypothetical protein
MLDRRRAWAPPKKGGLGLESGRDPPEACTVGHSRGPCKQDVTGAMLSSKAMKKSRDSYPERHKVTLCNQGNMDAQQH